MSDQDRIESLTSQLALVLGIGIGCAHKHSDHDALRMLLDNDFARELARKEPDRLIGQMMRTYRPSEEQNGRL